MVADDVAALPQNEAVGTLKNVLQRSRVINRESRAKQCEQDDQERKYQKLHGHGIGDRGIRILRLNMERSQQPCHWAGEEVVQYFSKPELFGHRAAFSYWPLALSSKPEIILQLGVRFRARARHTLRKRLRTRWPL